MKWYNLLNDEEKKLFEYYKNGDLKLFSKADCDYCKLLKTLLNNCGLKYEEIDGDEAEMLRIRSNPSLSTVKPFETVPQLFSYVKEKDEVMHLGGYDDNWKNLHPRINYKKLSNLSYELTINLNKIIDKNFYPIEKTKVSNLRHRPIGIGVQGLADLFLKLKLPFDSDEAQQINKEIFEAIYYGAMESSIDLAKKDGKYSSFDGSPLSEGLFQFNLWGLKDEDLSGRWDWNKLRENVMKYGCRNSLLVALMPTASTSQIMGSFVEAFEALTSNLYTRRTLAGEFTVVNKYLMDDLISLDMWNENTKSRLIYDKGSVQNIKGFPKFLKDIYKTVWEISQKNIIKMSADRGPFVCQSQSLNLFFEQPNFKSLTAAHFAGWKLGLKTGSYYIRSKPALSAQRFGLDAKKEKELKEEDEGCINCSA
jgi:ribonucleoside-diphosphate reductase alpha chain